MFAVILGLLGVFCAASVLYQCTAGKPLLRRFDRAGLLPNYSFFAPTPMVNDYRLVYRLDPAQPGEWKEIPTTGQRGLGRVLYNPEKYSNKAFIDSSNFLVEEYVGLKKENQQFIQISAYYIGMLRLVSDFARRERPEPAKARFAVISSENFDELKIKGVVFSSAVHPL